MKNQVLKYRWLGLAFALSVAGCASTTPRPVVTNAALGKVVVYRNGVAYFERYAHLEGQSLRLRVPGERIDDLLKSLTVVDARTGKALPVSFPTVEHVGDEVDVTIELPKPAPKNLRVSYVTESPAWKPSYRLKLSKSGPARLEAWAVVDNVSGEDWNQVAIGVGSTSALSFRYDLHSVRFVDRATLTDGTLLGAAPPSGGSPYAVASKELQVLANVSMNQLIGDDARSPEPEAMAEPRSGSSRPSKASAAPAVRAGSAQGAGMGRGQGPSLDVALSQVAARARQNKEKIRIEGYALSNDGDRSGASLERANNVRDKLVSNGVPKDQIEVMGTGRVAQGDVVRILAVQGEVAPQTPSSETAQNDAGLGDAYFQSQTPLTIEKGRSALVSMLSADVKAVPVYYYDPISARGSKKFAFRSVLLENPSDYLLDAGPFTVYAEGQFLGEGLSEPIPAKSKAFIPFALDRQVLIDTTLAGHDVIDRLVTIERGIVRAEARSVKTTKLVLHNRGTSEVITYVRHAPSAGHVLESPKGKVEKLGGAYLFEVKIPAGGEAALAIEESTPIQKTVDVRTEQGVADLGLYLKTATQLPEELRLKLEQVLAMHRELVELDEKLATISTQASMYRTRVEELNAQLVTLRKVPQAQELSRKLAKKMDEISDRLQHSTLEAASVEGDRLTRRVALEDKLAELTLEARRDAVAER